VTGISLSTPLASVAGGKTAKAIQSAFGFETVHDLLEHYPRRYSNRGELSNLRHLPVGETVTVVAQILDVRERPMQSRRGGILEVRITDGEGMLTLTFFNQQWRARELTAGKRGMFAGKAGEYRGSLQLAHPAYELFADDEQPDNAAALDAAAARAWATKPIPIYPAASAVNSWAIARVVQLILEGLGEVPDSVPEPVRRENQLLSYRDALQQIHLPTDEAQWRAARRTLRFMEAFQLQVALLAKKRDEQRRPAIARSLSGDSLVNEFDQNLPFVLTDEQISVGNTLSAELASTVPMHRLVQGEVGSGKTIVALRAMLQVAESGGQAALLAPTEVLAAQHFRSIVHTLGPDLAAQLNPVLIAGQLAAAEKKRALLSAASGNSRLVIGTHALMSEQTQFFDLGLVVIDEQHRFGVEQREQLKQKADAPPHVLVLTATPIPRTVALTAFGDLDVSTIRHVPSGRAEIVSHVVPTIGHPTWEERTWQRAAEEIRRGRQVFVVCPAIEAGEGANVTDTLTLVREHPALAACQSASLTGAQPSDEKESTMTAFAAGDIDLLVATTVIEVGVDVPNATLMIVRDADRFGVSQLHQLRGRVGRGAHQGLCIFITAAEPGSLARSRVDAVAATKDGFALAEIDLELRQEGDVLGSAQSGGRSTLKLLRVAKDGEIIEEAHSAAVTLLDSLKGEPIPAALAAAITRNFGSAAENIAKS
jgi:ATP-dependent DNA helicase RecG